jgi:hypothetical protein
MLTAAASSAQRARQRCSWRMSGSIPQVQPYQAYHGSGDWLY